MRIPAISCLMALAPVLAAAQASSQTMQHCEDLNRLNLPGIVVKSATQVAPGNFSPTGNNPRNVAAFCRVIGVVKPELGFELWLPAQWNRKYVGVGNGGLAGNIVYNAMYDPLSRGYATSSTDTGHVNAGANDGAWALGHMNRVIEYGQRGVHEMALASKALIRTYYGAAPVHSYFRDAPTAASRPSPKCKNIPRISMVSSLAIPPTGGPAITPAIICGWRRLSTAMATCRPRKSKCWPTR
jgi:feruloyl esterase